MRWMASKAISSQEKRVNSGERRIKDWAPEHSSVNGGEERKKDSHAD